MTARTINVTAYLQVEASDISYDGTRIYGAKAVGITQKKPANPKAGVVVKLNLQLPESVFLPLEPEATVIISAPVDLAEVATVAEITEIVPEPPGADA